MRGTITDQSGGAPQLSANVGADTEAARQRPLFLSAIALPFEEERARFFVWSPVCFAIGISAYFQLGAEPSRGAVVALLIAAITVFAITPKRTLASSLCLALVFAAAGFSVAKLRVETVSAPVLLKPLYNANITGWVTRAETRRPNGQRLTIAVESLNELPVAERPRFVRVRTLAKTVNPVVPGDRVRLQARLAPPSAPALPGGFDFARTAWFESLGGVGYSYRAADVIGRVDPPSWYWAIYFDIQALRSEVSRRVFAALPGESGGMAVALMTGERGGISDATSEAYRGSGLFHILSISGLHMVVMAGTVFFLVRLLLAAVPAIALRFPIKKIAAVVGMATALGYLAISGAAFATVRATVMMIVVFAAVLADRPALALRNVALSALIILIVYPESLFDAGFQMSFAAVTALVAAYEEVRRRRRTAKPRGEVWRGAAFFGGIVFTTLVASAAVAPFAAYHFHQSQQYAVLANALAVPICNIVVMPAVIAAFILMPFGLESLALWPLGKGIEAMTWCATFVAALPGAVSRIGAMPSLGFGLMVFGGLWLMLWQRSMRYLGVAAIVAGLLAVPAVPQPDILIGRNGQLVAARVAEGRLSALPARQSRFELGRWLEYDGDGRRPKDSQQGVGFRCDAIGCVARISGVDLMVPRHPAAFSDDCTMRTDNGSAVRPRIVALSVPRPDACAGAAMTGGDTSRDGDDDDPSGPHTGLPRVKRAAPRTVIDLFDIWREGTHAIYITPERGWRDNPASTPPVTAMSLQTAEPGQRIRIETVADFRGIRPWSIRAPSVRRTAKAKTSIKSGSEIGVNGGRASRNLPSPQLKSAQQSDPDATPQSRNPSRQARSGKSWRRLQRRRSSRFEDLIDDAELDPQDVD